MVVARGKKRDTISLLDEYTHIVCSGEEFSAVHHGNDKMRAGPIEVPLAGRPHRITSGQCSDVYTC